MYKRKMIQNINLISKLYLIIFIVLFFTTMIYTWLNNKINLEAMSQLNYQDINSLTTLEKENLFNLIQENQLYNLTVISYVITIIILIIILGIYILNIIQIFNFQKYLITQIPNLNIIKWFMVLGIILIMIQPIINAYLFWKTNKILKEF